MANTKRKAKTGRFINNVVRVDDAKQYAEDYYNQHKRAIDRLLEGKTTRNKKDVFVDMVEDLFDQNRSKYNNKKNLNAGIRSILDELQGIDPRLNEIKREAAGREEAGFGDLRKLNKKLSKQEIPFEPGFDDIVGYYDIQGSDYVIVHRLDYTFSTDSPENVYEYELRVNVGL